MLLRLLLSFTGFFSAVSQDALGSRGCTSSTCVFSNPYLRFGTGSETSVNTWGLFQQPWYYSTIANTWYKLTFANYPLDTAIGTGSGSSHWSGTSILNLYGLTPSYSFNDYSGFIVDSSDATKTVGHGTITATRIFSISGQTITFQNRFSLGQNDSFVKIVNLLINNSTTPVQNAYIWVGTRDDFVGVTDVNTKTRGNLINGNFVAITAPSQSSRAIMITNTNEGVLFYSETPGVMTAYALCCSFSNVYNLDPLTLAPSTPSPTDGSYAAVLPLGTIPVNASVSITWYYAAGVISSLGAVAQTVAAAQIADAGPLPSPTSVWVFPTDSSVSTFSIYPTLTGSGNITRSSISTFTSYPAPTAYPSITGAGSGSASASATSSSSSSASASASSSASATSSAAVTATRSPVATESTVATRSPVATASAVATASITPTPSTTPTLHIYFFPSTPQNIYIYETMVQDNTPFIYALIPLTISCCTVCLVVAYYSKKKYLEKQLEKKEEAVQTISVDPAVIHIRTVEEPRQTRQVRNAFRNTQLSGST